MIRQSLTRARVKRQQERRALADPRYGIDKSLEILLPSTLLGR